MPYGRELRAHPVFQSTPPRGGRPASRSRCEHDRDSFNPRPRAGGDHLAPDALILPACFNPRPRAGGDAVAVADYG